MKLSELHFNHDTATVPCAGGRRIVVVRDPDPSEKFNFYFDRPSTPEDPDSLFEDNAGAWVVLASHEDIDALTTQALILHYLQGNTDEEDRSQTDAA